VRLLVTGGAGFIGSAFVRQSLQSGRHEQILVLDLLTYAGNLENLAPVADLPSFRFGRVDIRDAGAVRDAFKSFRPEAVVHFAAESHVDRSIHSPAQFISTNVNGTGVLLEAAREWPVERFLHVSTDEVYGSIPARCSADEEWPLSPSNPYSASKASADLLVLAYAKTYALPVVITRASNNYGPYQFPEKLIPLMIANALADKLLPVYGDGRQVRDWLHVDDHCRALQAALSVGRVGEIYNIGGDCALENIEVVQRVLGCCHKPASLIEYVPDRPGHDRRYALDWKKIKSETGWEPRVTFDSGLQETVRWFRDNPEWFARVRSGEYRTFAELKYSQRGELPSA
jgi:dTDP-glucose 4,6-dehydratase